MSLDDRSLEPSDAIWTVPNLLTMFRLAILPPFLWLALGPGRIDLAFALASLGLVSDLVDGKIARRYGQVTKLGIALDPLSDRLGLAAGAVVMIVYGLAPLWAILAILGRDVLLVLVGVPILKARGIPVPPVSRVGKWGSFAVSIAVGLFLASGWSHPSEPIRWVAGLAWVMFVIGVPLYWTAGVGYIRVGLQGLRSTGGDRARPID